MHSLGRNQFMPSKVLRPAIILMEGSIAVAGSAVKWTRDQLGIIKKSDEVGQLALKVDGLQSFNTELTVDTAGVVFVTAFSGLWAPYWRSDVQGTICRPSINFINNQLASQDIPPKHTSVVQFSKASPSKPKQYWKQC
jgi:glycerol kinase